MRVYKFMCRCDADSFVCFVAYTALAKKLFFIPSFHSLRLINSVAVNGAKTNPDLNKAGDAFYPSTSPVRRPTQYVIPLGGVTIH